MSMSIVTNEKWHDLQQWRGGVFSLSVSILVSDVRHNVFSIMWWACISAESSSFSSLISGGSSQPELGMECSIPVII